MTDGINELAKHLAKKVIEAIQGSGLDASAVKFAADMAERVNRGEISETQAMVEMKAYGQARGWDTSDGPEEWLQNEDVQKGAWEEMTEGFIDVTEKVKKALLEAGQPGIADAFTDVKFHPSAIVVNQPNKVAIACGTKKWFSWEGMSADEHHIVTQAMKLAAESEGITWADGTWSME